MKPTYKCAQERILVDYINAFTDKDSTDAQRTEKHFTPLGVEEIWRLENRVNNVVGVIGNRVTLMEAQELDPLIGEILHAKRIGRNESPNPEVRQFVAKHGANCETVDGILFYHTGKNEMKIFLPKAWREEVLIANHDDFMAGHLGQHKTRLRIMRKYYWPNMRQEIISYVQSCKSCQLRKGPLHQNCPALKPLQIVGPYERLVIDTVGPLNMSKKGNKHILVVTDWFTKWVEMFALPDITADTISRVIVEEIICRYGAPKEILSDLGSAFNSNWFKAVCKQCNTVKVYSTPYAPQTQGIVERFNGTMKDMIATCVGPSRKWDEVLPYLRLAYNGAVHEVTGYSPYYMNFARDPCMPHDASMPIPNHSDLRDHYNFLATVRARLTEAWTAARQAIGKEQRRQKRIFDERAKERPVEVNSLVMLKLPPAQLKESQSQFHPKWRGPYRVVEVRDMDVVVRSIDNPFLPPKTLHKRLVAPFYQRNLPNLQEPSRMLFTGPTIADLQEEYDTAFEKESPE